MSFSLWQDLAEPHVYQKNQVLDFSNVIITVHADKPVRWNSIRCTNGDLGGLLAQANTVFGTTCQIALIGTAPSIAATYINNIAIQVSDGQTSETLNADASFRVM